MAALDSLEIINVSGKGRAYLLLQEQQQRALEIARVRDTLAEKGKVVHLRLPLVARSNWRELANALSALLVELKIRQASFLGFGASSHVCLQLYLEQPKAVRTLILLDATTRAHPSRLERVFGSIEEHLPMGLPFRKKLQGLDAKPFLQRVRCPVLLVSSPHSTVYEQSEAEVFESGLPTAWRAALQGSSDSYLQELPSYIADFQEVPAKCPQKNIRRGLAAQEG